MPEESHLEEMNAAIRAQRERHAVPRTMVPEPEPAQQPEPPPQPEKRGLLSRLLSRSR
ncbi:MAG: hypothetical protein JOZ56_04660 [Actinobacteria bacterium]|nr:hypothetical protein [Actinomycetota bacterium]